MENKTLHKKSGILLNTKNTAHEIHFFNITITVLVQHKYLPCDAQIGTVWITNTVLKDNLYFLEHKYTK